MGAILNEIPSTGNWSEIATRINQNFARQNTEVDRAQKVAGLNVPLFASTTQANQYIKSPQYGQTIMVGSGFPATVCKWNGSGWESVGSSGSVSAQLGNYYTKSEIDSQKIFVKNTNEVTI